MSHPRELQQPGPDALPHGVRGLCFEHLPHCYACGSELDHGHYFSLCTRRDPHKWIRCFEHHCWALMDDKDLVPPVGQCNCNVDDVYPQSTLVSVQWWAFSNEHSILAPKEEFVVPRGLVDYLTRVHIPSQGYEPMGQTIFYKTSMRGVTRQSMLHANRDWRTTCKKMGLLTPFMYNRFVHE